jgi:hypothetical protein
MTINVIDAAGATQAINTLPNTGVATELNSLPVVGAVDTSPTISGTLSAANTTLEAFTTGYNLLSVQVTGTFSATLQIQGTIDGTTWVSVGTSRTNSYAGTSTSTITAAGIYFVDVTGLVKTRILVSTYVSGTATITGVLSVGGPTAVNVPAISTISTLSLVSSANLGIPAPASTTADAASAAITTTTTTATIAPTFGCSYEVNIAVTVVSGTSPTMDVIVQESDDGGVNWFDVYHFERITAIGYYRSPKMPLTGNRIRYVQLIGGTSPSFTRVINRLQSSDSVPPIRRFFDRSFNSAPVATNQSAVTLATGGVFTLTGNTTPISVGDRITITGTLGGTGSITGYVSGADYIVTSTNGTTSVTLASNLGTALTTTAGTPTGLTFTVDDLIVSSFTRFYSVGNPSKYVQLSISSGALTTAPAFKMQGSEDGGLSWYDIPGATLTAVASTAAQVTVSNVRAELVRAIVTGIGSSVTLNYIAIKVFD